MEKQVIINADDLGLHSCIDQAIVDLSQKGIISSTSLMVYGNPSVDTLTILDQKEISIGLHFDLTSNLLKQDRLIRYKNVKDVIQNSWFRQLSLSQLIKEVHHQLDRFESLVGRPPVFIDGHEHVHQFPVIREAIWDVLGKRNLLFQIYLRSTRPLSPFLGGKAALIYWLGGRYHDRYCRKHQIVTNNGFAGSYDFNPFADLSCLWKTWIKSLPDKGGLIMCHPAKEDKLWSDGIANARVHEYQFLGSSLFQELLKSQNVKITSWSSLFKDSKGS